MCFLLFIIGEKPIMREQSDWLVQKAMSHEQDLSANWEGCDGETNYSDIILLSTCVVTSRFPFGDWFKLFK